MYKVLEGKFIIKEIILSAGFKLFMEKGFGEAFVNDLIKATGITKEGFYYYFNSKDQLISETIETLFFPHFDDIYKLSDEYNECAKDQLQKIFQRYSELEDYLKNSLSVRTFNYRSITCLMVEGIKDYKAMTNCIFDFNNKLLEKIEYIINEGRLSGEILSEVDSKLIAKHTLTLLQNSIVLWVMNQSIDIKRLFEVNFKYLWNKIKSPESNFE